MLNDENTVPTNLRAADIITRPRDSVRERKIAQEIRKLPEEARYQLIRELVNRDDIVALIFANACLRKKDYFEELLEHAIQTVDISSMKYWLQCIVPRLGFRAVVARLMDKLESDPSNNENVRKVWYQLIRFVPKHDPHAVKAWKEFNRVLTKRGLIDARGFN